MRFVFGCWSFRRGGQDTFEVVKAMSRFFSRQDIACELFALSPVFAVGVASAPSCPSILRESTLDTARISAVGEATLYDEQSVAADGTPLSSAADELLRVTLSHDRIPSRGRMARKIGQPSTHG